MVVQGFKHDTGIPQAEQDRHEDTLQLNRHIATTYIISHPYQTTIYHEPSRKNYHRREANWPRWLRPYG